MAAPTDAVLLRIFVGEEDQYEGRPLYEALVRMALKHKMAGATALRGPGGFGRSRYVRTELNVDAGSKLPMVVEIVDEAEKIDAFLPQVEPMVESGLVTLEGVRIVRYSRDRVPNGVLKRSSISN
ncbi:MAG TPA: DUF190 domain-containing protein [Rhizomicrobium sp.]|jgi:hypothetical protein|nr:DUF190 domain-containing protein [Rhizomicrobium sp.]